MVLCFDHTPMLLLCPPLMGRDLIECFAVVILCCWWLTDCSANKSRIGPVLNLSACVCCSDAIAVKQSQVDKLYASLKDLALERRDKLGEVLKLYKLNREIEDLEQWIAEREVVAGSHELGQDFEHVTVINHTDFVVDVFFFFSLSISSYTLFSCHCCE